MIVSLLRNLNKKHFRSPCSMFLPLMFFDILLVIAIYLLGCNLVNFHIFFRPACLFKLILAKLMMQQRWSERLSSRYLASLCPLSRIWENVTREYICCFNIVVAIMSQTRSADWLISGGTVSAFMEPVISMKNLREVPIVFTNFCIPSLQGHWDFAVWERSFVYCHNAD
jgi:hypothetical protein